MSSEASVSPKGRVLSNVSLGIVGFDPVGHKTPTPAPQIPKIGGASQGAKPSSEPMLPAGNGQGPCTCAATKFELSPVNTISLNEIDLSAPKFMLKVARAQEETNAGGGC